MDSPNLPPPLPGKKSGNFWAFLVAGLGFAALVLVSVFGVKAVQRFQKKQTAAVEAYHDIEKSAAAEREKMADSIAKGETEGSDESIGRLKQQLEKSAGQMSGDDAAAASAMASYLAKMQTSAREYEAALKSMLEAEVLSFKLHDRAMIEKHRQLLREFAAANDRVTAQVRNSEQIVRGELSAAKVSDRTIEATMNGFNKGRPQRQLQIRIREEDHKLGVAGLRTLDLLDQSWGKWSIDSASGQLRFEDDATLEAFNAEISKIQDAAAAQTTAQQELADKMRAMSRP